MTPDELREAGRIIAARRGEPVTDPAILSKVAALIVGKRDASAPVVTDKVRAEGSRTSPTPEAGC